MLRFRTLFIFGLLFSLLPVSLSATTIPNTRGIADLTNGGKLTRVNLRWAGPIGIFCGTWRPRRQKITDVRQIQVMSIMKGSPSDGVLELDDVILGADGTGANKVPLFQGDQSALMPLARAISDAEARDPATLKLLVWRPKKNEAQQNRDPYRKVDLRSVPKMLQAYKEGETLTLEIKLNYMGQYSDTAPYDCEKSKNILRQGLKALVESEKPGVAGLGALCLLAGDDPSNPDNQKNQAKAKEWIYKMIENKEYGSPWMSGPRLITLSEYYMKTKDEKVLPELIKRAEYHASRISWIGTSGHRWADVLPDGSRGRISGYGAINGSGVLGFLGLALAKKAGVNSTIVDDAVRRQRSYYGHYAERGGIIYGEWPYWISGTTGEENGRHALPALALGALGEVRKAKFFTRMATTATWGNRTSAHGGPFMGAVWQPVAAAQGGVKAAHFHFQEIQWHLELKRHFNGLRIEDPTHPKYTKFSEAATALLFYAAPLKQLIVTGRDRNQDLELTEAEFAETAATKTFNAEELTTDELIDSLSKYLGMLRKRTTPEIAKRAKDPENVEEGKRILTKLIALAGDKKASPTGRTGAVRAIKDIKHKVGEPILSMMNEEIAKLGMQMVKESDHYVRQGGAAALGIVPPEMVRPYADELMDAILAIDRPTFPLDEDNPCRWDHGSMGDVFMNKVVQQGLDGLDREKLTTVFRSLLNTPMSTSRTNVAKGMQVLNKEETLQVAGSLIDCMRYGSPIGAAGDKAPPYAQNLLAKHHFEEGLYLSLLYNPANAIKSKIPEAYGRSALQTQSIREIIGLIGDSLLVQCVEGMDKVMPQLLNGQGPEKLNTLKAIHKVSAETSSFSLPSIQTQLSVDATNYALPKEEETTYTWRKVYGAGKVDFSPNGSPDSKNTTVTFSGKKPGKYRFEVAMSDTLGLSVLRKTVDVILNGSNGKLPANQPPEAEAQTLKATSGLPLSFTLKGTDPDGDDLGFKVRIPPTHGRLDGHGADLTYTPDLGFNGTDELTFVALDGQGEVSMNTVTFNVSDKDVGVAIYEGFDYPPGPILDNTGGSSFGFDGPWKKNDGKPGPNSFLADTSVVDKKTQSPSLHFSSLPATGGRMVKGERHRHAVRVLDPKVLEEHKLLENGKELWFSTCVGPNSRGDTEIRFALATDNLQIGFQITGLKIYPTLNGDRNVGINRNPWTRHINLRDLRKPKEACMIVGRFTWGETEDEEDTMEIFRVYNAPEFGPTLIEEPVSSLKQVIQQKDIKYLNLQSEASVDEIRIGTDLHSVMVGTKPL